MAQEVNNAHNKNQLYILNIFNLRPYILNSKDILLKTAK